MTANAFCKHPQASTAARKAVTYFTNNQHRMDYPTYRENGYQIGSGTIESACKQIVTQRLKVSGAIWELDNAIKTVTSSQSLREKLVLHGSTVNGKPSLPDANICHCH